MFDEFLLTQHHSICTNLRLPLPPPQPTTNYLFHIIVTSTMLTAVMIFSQEFKFKTIFIIKKERKEKSEKRGEKLNHIKTYYYLV